MSKPINPGSVAGDAQANGSMATVEHADANILIIDRDRDCADALSLLLSGLSGVGHVQTVRTAADALRGAPSAVRLLPDVILVDASHLYATEQSLLDVLTALRRQYPLAAIIPMSIYPERFSSTLLQVADRCLRKDTTVRDLQALLGELRSR